MYVRLSALRRTTEPHRWTSRLSDEQQQLVDSFADLLAKESVARAGPGRGAARARSRPLGATRRGRHRPRWRRRGRRRVGRVAARPRAGRRAGRAEPWRPRRSSRRRSRPGSWRPSAPERRRSSRSRPRSTATRAGHRSRCTRPVGGDGCRSCPAGAIADHVVALDGDRLVRRADRRPGPPPGGQPRRACRWPTSSSADGAVELADGAAAPVRLRDRDRRVADADRRRARRHRRAGPSTWRAAYAVERRAWGVPIGTFQAVSHPLADSATDARRRPPAGPQGGVEPRTADPGRRSELAAMAFAFASETARDATYHVAAHPRRLRLHARARRAALLPPGPRLGPGAGATPRPGLPPGRRRPSLRTGGADDGLHLERPRPRRSRAEVRRVPRRAPPARARGRDLRDRRVPRRRRSSGRWPSATGSRPGWDPRRLRRPISTPTTSTSSTTS